MKNKLWIILLAALPLLAWLGCGQQDQERLTVGILQTASHPALDRARDGFIAAMQDRLGDEVAFIIQNAEGSLSQAQAIASSFHRNKAVDAIYAIGTPAAQMAAQVEKSKPIFIAAVTDPAGLGLLEPGSNVAGTTDRVDTQAQVALLRMLVPEVERVAVVYNPGEHNSVVMIDDMIAELDRVGLAHTEVAVHTQGDVATAITLAARKGDVLLIPADNLLVSAMPLVVKTAMVHGIPVIVSDSPSVSVGALATQGVDYHDCGWLTGEQALRILVDGETITDVGFVDPDNSTIYINEKSLAALEISLPEGIAGDIRLVGGR